MLRTSRIATAEPTPDPVADLRFFTSLVAVAAPVPVPVAARKRLRIKVTEEVPTPDPEPCRTTNKNGSASLDDVPDPVADLKSISRSVLVDAPADPDPLADRTTT